MSVTCRFVYVIAIGIAAFVLFDADLNAVIIHPLHKDLPSLVCYMAPTCNKFTTKDCSDKYETLKAMYKESGLEHVLGPVLGTSSDGDSRRRLLQTLRMWCCSCSARDLPPVLFLPCRCAEALSASDEEKESRFRAVKHLSFAFSVAQHPSPATGTPAIPYDIPDQDYLQ